MRRTGRNVFGTPQQNAVQVRQKHTRPQDPASECGGFDGCGAPGCGAVETVKTTISAQKHRFPSTRLNKIFILFNLVYPRIFGRRFPPSIVSAFYGAVKIEQNNCSCSVRAAAVVYRTCSKRLFSALPRTSSLANVSGIDERTGQTVGATAKDGASRPLLLLIHFFFLGFGSGVAPSASRSTCAVSSRSSTSSM